MVVICGLDVNVKNLPYEKAIEYIVKPNEIDVRMLQKTKLLQQCTEIYTTFDMVDYIPSKCRSKTFLVKDVEELQVKLLGQPQSDYMEQLVKENTPLPEKTHIAETVASDVTDNVTENSTDDVTVTEDFVENAEDVFDVGSEDFDMLLQSKDDEIRHRDEIIAKMQSIIENFERQANETATTDEVEQLRNRIAELETTVSEKEAAFATNETAMAAEMCEQLNALQTEISEKDAILADKDRELLEKDNLLTESNRTIESLNVQINNLSANNTDMAAITEQLGNLTNECNVYKSENERQKDDIWALQEELETVKSDCNVRTEENVQYQSTVNELTAQLDEVNNECDSFRAENEKNTLEIAKLKEQIKAERKTFEQDKAEYERALEQYENEQQSSEIVTRLNPYLHGVGKKPVPAFTAKELAQLQKYAYDNISLVCFGSGASIAAGLRGIQTVHNKGDDYFIVDCTGDAWLPTVLHLDKKPGLLVKPNGNIADMVMQRVTTEIVRTNACDDIMLFALDWVAILEKIVKYANGRKTLILLGSVKSFAVKYTMLKLAQVVNTTLIVKADPHSAQNLFWDLLNVPADRITLGVIEYTPVVKQIFDSFVTKYTVKITKTNDITEVLGSREE